MPEGYWANSYWANSYWGSGYWALGGTPPLVTQEGVYQVRRGISPAFMRLLKDWLTTHSHFVTDHSEG